MEVLEVPRPTIQVDSQIAGEYLPGGLPPTSEEQPDWSVFSPEDFRPGGRCWPPHPVFDLDEEPGIVLELGDLLEKIGDNGDEGAIAQGRLFESIEDYQEILKVMTGQRTLESLIEEWGMEDGSEGYSAISGSPVETELAAAG